jgi:hypothetical protein
MVALSKLLLDLLQQRQVGARPFSLTFPAALPILVNTEDKVFM